MTATTNTAAATTTHNVLIDWTDGQVADTDEIAVDAETREDAVLFALAQWRDEFCEGYPHCQLVSVSFAADERVDTPELKGTPVHLHHDASRTPYNDVCPPTRLVRPDDDALRLYPRRLGEEYGPKSDSR